MSSDDERRANAHHRVKRHGDRGHDERELESTQGVRFGDLVPERAKATAEGLHDEEDDRQSD
jgi:hypothetical protein